ncbi:unnamed protein product [Lathyrus sativus]|nr:unnamed protein product [Lathyrus sativus]
MSFTPPRSNGELEVRVSWKRIRSYFAHLEHEEETRRSASCIEMTLVILTKRDSSFGIDTVTYEGVQDRNGKGDVTEERHVETERCVTNGHEIVRNVVWEKKIKSGKSAQRNILQIPHHVIKSYFLRGLDKNEMVDSDTREVYDVKCTLHKGKIV